MLSEVYQNAAKQANNGACGGRKHLKLVDQNDIGLFDYKSVYGSKISNKTVLVLFIMKTRTQQIRES